MPNAYTVAKAIECTSLYEMRGIEQFPHAYMLHLIRTYAKGYNRND